MLSWRELRTGKLITNGRSKTSRYPCPVLRPGIIVVVLYLERCRILIAKSEKWGLLLFCNQIGPESDSELRSNWKR